MVGIARAEWGFGGRGQWFLLRRRFSGLRAQVDSNDPHEGRWGERGEGGGGADGHGVMLVTLASANFGTARENFSLDFPRKTRTALDTANRLEL